MSDAKAFQVVWDLPQVVVWLTSETTIDACGLSTIGFLRPSDQTSCWHRVYHRYGISALISIAPTGSYPAHKLCTASSVSAHVKDFESTSTCRPQSTLV